MAYGESLTSTGAIRRYHYQGKRFSRQKLSPAELLEMQLENDPNSFVWHERAAKAHSTVLEDWSIPTEIYNSIVDILDELVSDKKLTWRDLFYIWRIAHYTWALGENSLGEIVSNCGLSSESLA